MELKNQEKELLAFVLGTSLVIGIFSFAMFGITGLRVVLGILFLSFPFYLIMKNFELAEGEKIIFSVLLGLTIFPSLVYLFGLIVSFRMSIIIVFIAFMALALVLWKFKK